MLGFSHWSTLFYFIHETSHFSYSSELTSLISEALKEATYSLYVPFLDNTLSMPVKGNVQRSLLESCLNNIISWFRIEFK